ncbi:cupredoxin family copper-binding protein [Candidatus Parcubacteria bacterium]|nr:cupredoxin family copper-binding protein [Candidatus Parcubacteria bacterium]
MKRGFGLILIAAVVAAIAGVLLVNSSRPAADQAANQTVPAAGGETGDGQAEADGRVTVQGFAFKPAVLTVKKGTTVTWTNRDSAKHNVVSAEDSPAQGLNGPLLAKGESYEYTFTETGTYQYFCEPHPYMKGTVEVTE